MDRIAVFATVSEKSFYLSALSKRLGEHRLTVDDRKLEHSLERLELAFILGREQGRYTYRVPLFRDMLCQDSPQEKLKMAMQSLVRF